MIFSYFSLLNLRKFVSVKADQAFEKVIELMRIFALTPSSYKR
jgi:hypothetical protein